MGQHTTDPTKTWAISQPYAKNVPALIGALVSEGSVCLHTANATDVQTYYADAAAICVNMPLPPVPGSRKIARARKLHKAKIKAKK